MSASPLLSICIPTFNNPTGVGGELKEFSTEAKLSELTQEIEFCIADNSENNTTEDVVKEIISDSAITIRYVHNNHNLGYDRNVDKVLSMATGQYCWLLSDNDKVKPDSLKELIRSIQEAPDTVVFIICESRIPTKNLTTYPNMESAMLANDLWIPGGLVSRNIIKRSQIPSDLSAFFDNDWIHLSITTLIAGDKPVTFIPDKFVYNRTEKNLWTKDGKTFFTYTNLMKIMSGLPTPPYSQAFLDKINNKLMQGLPANILSSKVYGLKISKSTIRCLYHIVARRPLWLTLCFGALMVPTYLLIYAKGIKNHIYH